MRSASPDIRFLILCGPLVASILMTACANHRNPVISTDFPHSEFMNGIPTSGDGIIDNDISWIRDLKKSQWATQNISIIHNVDVISRGDGPIVALPYANKDILDFHFEDVDGNSLQLGTLLRRLRTDAFIVLKDGEIFAELYFNGMKPDTRHQMNSVTKSLVGALVGKLIFDQSLDANAPITNHLPELANSGMADATLQQALDMTISIDGSMSWTDPESIRIRTFKSAGFIKKEEDFPYQNSLELLASARKKGAHGAKFQYKPTSTELLGWSVSRVTGQSWQNKLSEFVWSKLGAERDAFVIVDPGGHGFAAAGMSATLRDLARFGLMLENDGFYNGSQIVPSEWIRATIRGNDAVRRAMQSDRELSAYGNGVFYHNHLRVLDSKEGEILATGGLGQKIYVNQKHNLVGVFFANNPIRSDVVHQVHLLRQIRDYLDRQ